jgi:hypothetical protein
MPHARLPTGAMGSLPFRVGCRYGCPRIRALPSPPPGVVSDKPMRETEPSLPSPSMCCDALQEAGANVAFELMEYYALDADAVPVLLIEEGSSDDDQAQR